MEPLNEILTESNIAILNAARSVLKRIHVSSYPDEFGVARVVVLAEHAENAIFQTISSASTWGNLDLSRAQVHNHTNEQIVSDAMAEAMLMATVGVEPVRDDQRGQE